MSLPEELGAILQLARETTSAQINVAESRMEKSVAELKTYQDAFFDRIGALVSHIELQVRSPADDRIKAMQTQCYRAEAESKEASKAVAGLSRLFTDFAVQRQGQDKIFESWLKSILRAVENPVPVLSPPKFGQTAQRKSSRKKSARTR